MVTVTSAPGAVFLVMAFVFGFGAVALLAILALADRKEAATIAALAECEWCRPVTLGTRRATECDRETGPAGAPTHRPSTNSRSQSSSVRITPSASA